MLDDTNEKEMHGSDILQKAVASLRDTPVPPGPAGDLVAGTLAALDRQESDRKLIKIKERILAMKRITKIAAAAILIGVVGLIVWLVPSDNRSGLAFADIVRPILTARTATYKITTNYQGKSMVQDAMFMEPGYMRFVSPGTVMVSNVNQGRTLILIPAEKQAIVGELQNISDKPDGINLFLILRNRVLEAEKLDNKSVEFLGERQIEDKTAVGYHVKRVGLDIVIWADKETKLPVTVETRSGPVSNTMSDFVFDVHLDESLFNTDVPKGYAVKTEQLDMSEATEKDLVEMFKLWSEKMDGNFPTSMDIGAVVLEFMNHQREKMEALRHKPTDADMSAIEKDTMKIARGGNFVKQLPAESDCHYVGKGVKLGEADKPVFWYRPTDSPTYRVIYGDLSVRDVLPSELPAVPQENTTAPDQGSTNH
jgi:outer membrane lipoprotein-sorting protein